MEFADERKMSAKWCRIWLVSTGCSMLAWLQCIVWIAQVMPMLHIQNIHILLLILISRPHFSLDVRTRASEGLLFFAATRGGLAHLALYISKGRIRLSVGREKEIFNREKYNDGKWHSVSKPVCDQKIITTHSTISRTSSSLSDTVWWLCS